MIKLGGWRIKVSIDKYPQKIASSIGNLNILGCEYKAIAYLGSQIANGTNHAILAEQTVMNGKDSKNATVLVFNEKPDSTDVSLIDVKRIVESGAPTGGIKVEMTTKIPEDAKNSFEEAISKFVGSKIVPVVYVGSQVVKGIDYIFVATIEPVTIGAQTEVIVLTVNTLSKYMKIQRVFDAGGGDNVDASPIGGHVLGYAFNW